MAEGSWAYTIGSRALQRVMPGVGVSRAQVPVYAAAWRRENATALDGPGRLWVALGDSAAQGIGASTKEGGWVGQLRGELVARPTEPPWRLVNLSRSGARTLDVLDEQLPALHELTDVALVTCAVGGNDLLHRTPTALLVAQVSQLIEALPPGSVVATLSKGLGRRKPEAVNEVIRTRGPARGLLVADVWASTGPPWRGKYARDGLHPNEVGYAEWAGAFAEALGLRSGASSGVRRG
ncbi:MAG TPA: GDSL-type esterase/lipase family protein [Mycobacteriales bacterium]|nr:GDSL-type esterase/lipase family protein [Mycobacteriales bacterium]